MAGMNTLKTVKTISQFDGEIFVEWTKSYNDILHYFDIFYVRYYLD